MDIEKNIYELWWEDEAGNKCVTDVGESAPPKFRFYHAETVTVRHDVMAVAQEEDVARCPHDGRMVPDPGLIPGLEGRHCARCWGYQSHAEGEEWPDEWSFGHSRPVASGMRGFHQGLVLAMTRPTEQERARARDRVAGDYEPVVPRQVTFGTVDFVNPEYAKATGARVGDALRVIQPDPRLWDLHTAILISARACERCMNVLLYEYGCEDGYPHGSDEYRKAGTTCPFCEFDG